MSKGWESKSVEEQQAAAAQAEKTAVPANAADEAERQALELQRERILSERTSSPHRRSALSAALIDIEERLAQLGWTIHM
jgi:hypothetical protein